VGLDPKSNSRSTAKVLFTWELGEGNGHLMSLKPLAARWSRSGHTVAIAARDVLGARQAFAARYAGYSAVWQVEPVMARIEQVAA